MNARRKAVFTLLLVLGASGAYGQHRYFSDAQVGIDRVPIVVTDFDQAQDVWRRLGFRLKPGTQGGQDEQVQIKFDDGAGIDLVSPGGGTDAASVRLLSLLEQGEGAAGFSLHARDMGLFTGTLRGSPFKFGTVSRTFLDMPSLAFVSVTQDSRARDDAAWLRHPNGATALSRLWLAPSRSGGRDLRRLLAALQAEVTGAKVYAPEDVQATVATVANGEVLILPQQHQLLEERPVIGVTFEVESLALLRRRFADMGIAFTAGGAQNQSLVVAPDVTHGLWVEFRE